MVELQSIGLKIILPVTTSTLNPLWRVLMGPNVVRHLCYTQFVHECLVPRHPRPKITNGFYNRIIDSATISFGHSAKGSLHRAKCIVKKKKHNWSRLLRTSDKTECAPSNKTMTLSTQPRQSRFDSGDNPWMCLPKLVRTLNWPSLEIPAVHPSWGLIPKKTGYCNCWHRCFTEYRMWIFASLSLKVLKTPLYNPPTFRGSNIGNIFF